MIFDTPQTLKERITETSGRRVYSAPRVFEDTSNVFAITSGDVVRLEDHDYFVMGDAYEGRFGMDDEPKLWVKYAVCLTSGKHKIIKLVFDEEFSTRIGVFLIKATRSAQKEADFLSKVKGHSHFMQGVSVRDTAGNLVRIIDRIRGDSLFNAVLSQRLSHEEYYQTLFPSILKNLIVMVEAMQFAASQGTHHGDIRNDHIFVETDTGIYKWIDFDYSVTHSDYDLWSFGNIVIFAAAGGLLLHKDIAQSPEKYPHLKETITSDDCSLFHRYRVANVKKVYPYISSRLNDICLRHSIGGIAIYENYESLLSDLEGVYGNL